MEVIKKSRSLSIKVLLFISLFVGSQVSVFATKTGLVVPKPPENYAPPKTVSEPPKQTVTNPAVADWDVDDINSKDYWNKKVSNLKEQDQRQAINKDYKPNGFVKSLNWIDQTQRKVFGNKYFINVPKVINKVGSAIFHPVDFLREDAVPFVTENILGWGLNKGGQKVASMFFRNEIAEMFGETISKVSSGATRLVAPIITKLFNKKIVTHFYDKFLNKFVDQNDPKIVTAKLKIMISQSFKDKREAMQEYKDAVSIQLFKKFGIKDKKIHDAYIKGRKIYGVASHYYERFKYIMSTVRNTTKLISVSYELMNNVDISTGLKLESKDKFFRTIRMLRHLADNYINVTQIFKLDRHYSEDETDTGTKKYVKTGFRWLKTILSGFVTLADLAGSGQGENSEVAKLMAAMGGGDMGDEQDE